MHGAHAQLHKGGEAVLEHADGGTHQVSYDDMTVPAGLPGLVVSALVMASHAFQRSPTFRIATQLIPS